METISELSGGYISMFKGKGLDFEGFRDYTSQDDSRDIDWKASLRAKKLLVRVLREERNLQVFFVFDVSDSMLSASTDKLKCEYAAEVIAALSSSVLKAGDSVSLIMFSDGTNKMVQLDMASYQYFKILRELSNPKNYGGKFNFAKTLKFLNSYLPGSCIVIFVSDFIGLDESWKRPFKIASRKFDFLLSIMIRDPIDNEFPEDSEQIALEDPFSPTKLLIDPSLISNAYNLKSKEIKEKIKAEIVKTKSDIIELITNKPFEGELVRFLIRCKERWS